MNPTNQSSIRAIDSQAGLERRPSGFRTSAGQSRYLAAYDATLALWPVAYESIHMRTRYGITHVIGSGPANAPPLLLLHAASFSATDWLPNIAALSQNFRTYAVDILGEPGKSVQTRSLKNISDVGDWLLDVLDKLDIQRISMAGHSFGGWITVGFALHAPERLNRIVLLAPAASIHRFSWQTRLGLSAGRIMWMLPSNLVLTGTLRGVFTRPESVNPTFMRQFAVGVKEFRFPSGGVMPDVYSDAELRRMSVPTLLLIGENDMIYPPQAALDNANELIPGLQGELISDAGHGLNVDQSELINSRMLGFLLASD